jgi:hypothetical protein
MSEPIANVDMANAWDGEDGDQWTQFADEFDGQATAANEWIMVVRESLAAGRDLPMPPPGAPGPAALADPDDVEALLTGVGFEAVEFTSFEEPLWFGADADVESTAE